jgi:hypothetical protein
MYVFCISFKTPMGKIENTTYTYVNIASLKTSYEKACE